MVLTETFKVGDRVKIKADRVDGYLQPWRNRFKSGRQGTVSAIYGGGRLWVNWDNAKNALWGLTHHESDLEKVQP